MVHCLEEWRRADACVAERERRVLGLVVDAVKFSRAFYCSGQVEQFTQFPGPERSVFVVALRKDGVYPRTCG